MNVADLHPRACEAFGARARVVAPGQWTSATPCAGWDVRALVNHVVAEDRWTPPLLAGRTIAEVGDRFAGDLLGDDPVGACEDAAREAVAAMAGEGVLERTVHLSFGDVPGREYALQLFADHLIHAWDLARATGGDETLEADLVAACAAWFDGAEAAYREAGVIGPRPALPADADPQAVLLARFGRSAW